MACAALHDGRQQQPMGWRQIGAHSSHNTDNVETLVDRNLRHNSTLIIRKMIEFLHLRREIRHARGKLRNEDCVMLVCLVGFVHITK